MEKMVLDPWRQDEIVGEVKQAIYDASMRKYCYDAEFREKTLAPHVIYNATVTKDGDEYCCLYGKNLQEGISGWGKTPAEACANFDHIWNNGE